MKRVLGVLLTITLLGVRLEAQTPLQDAAAQLKIAGDALAKAAAALQGTPVVVTGACKTTPVPAGADLQAAINTALPCDTLVLAAGATFVGNFVLPVKSGTARTTITTSAALPNGRVGPSSASLMPKLQASPGGLPVLRTAPGAAHYVIHGIEMLPLAQGVNDIIDLGDGSNAQTTLAQVPDDLILDQCYIHGDAVAGQKRGVGLNSSNTTISNSYISGIRAPGQDSQAIAGWNGPGPYTITNNFLEAAGENVLFGGSDPAIAGLVPSNIILSGNTISKPLAWHGVSGWNVKNLIELKSAAHVVISGNVVENVWADAQEGYALVLTVRNQDGGCPQCTLQDVKVKGNVFRHAGAFLNLLAVDDGHGIGALSVRAAGIEVSNNIVYDIDTVKWGGSGRIFQVIDGPNGLILDHNTIAAPSSGGWINSLFTLQNGKFPIAGLVVTNNIFPEGAYGIIGAGDLLGVSAQILPHYAPGFLWSSNTVIVGDGAGSYPYPAGTVVSKVGQVVLNPDLTPAVGFSGGAGVLTSTIPGLVLP